MDENKTYGTRLARLWKLFLSTLYISSFTFGGGFVIVTFMKKKFVDELHWIDEQEMLDMTALAQSSPGAIAVNAAILVGWQVEGLIGMIVAVLGTIIPPMVILSVISVFYNAFATNRYIALLLKGMQAGVAAVILAVVFDLGGKVLQIRCLMSMWWWSYLPLQYSAWCWLWSSGKKVVQNDLLTAFSQLFAGGYVQRRRRLCGHAPDPEPSGGTTWLADDGGVY